LDLYDELAAKLGSNLLNHLDLISSDDYQEAANEIATTRLASHCRQAVHRRLRKLSVSKRENTGAIPKWPRSRFKQPAIGAKSNQLMKRLRHERPVSHL
jgi:hypothetical protein